MQNALKLVGISLISIEYNTCICYKRQRNYTTTNKIYQQEDEISERHSPTSGSQIKITRRNSE